MLFSNKGIIPTPILSFLYLNWEEALIALADVQPTLVKYSTIFWDSATSPSFVGIVFNGFKVPIVSIVVNGNTNENLLDVFLSYIPINFNLVLSSSSSLINKVKKLPDDNDLWLCKNNQPSIFNTHTHIKPITDRNAYLKFCNQAKLNFALPEMLQFGHHFGYWESGELLSSVSLNYIIPKMGYAHIGNIATLPNQQKKGLASMCLNTSIASISMNSTITQLGLFSDSKNLDLLNWYSKFGFEDTKRDYYFYFNCSKKDFAI
jgi:ribosomal protein S18 acetylase RimI-like enzyme